MRLFCLDPICINMYHPFFRQFSSLLNNLIVLKRQKKIKNAVIFIIECFPAKAELIGECLKILLSAPATLCVANAD